MPTAAKKSASTATAKKSRKMLTPAERVAKAEQELAKLKAKAAERDSETVKKLKTKRAALLKQVAERNEKIRLINVDLAKLDSVEDSEQETAPETDAT